jgi:hypothetical protein
MRQTGSHSRKVDFVVAMMGFGIAVADPENEVDEGGHGKIKLAMEILCTLFVHLLFSFFYIIAIVFCCPKQRELFMLL